MTTFSRYYLLKFQKKFFHCTLVYSCKQDCVKVSIQTSFSLIQFIKPPFYTGTSLLESIDPRLYKSCSTFIFSNLYIMITVDGGKWYSMLLQSPLVPPISDRQSVLAFLYLFLAQELSLWRYTGLHSARSCNNSCENAYDCDNDTNIGITKTLH